MKLKIAKSPDFQAQALVDVTSVLNADLSAEEADKILEKKSRSPEYQDEFNELMAVDDLLGQLEQDALLMSYVDDCDYSRVSTRSAPGFRMLSVSLAASVLMAIALGLIWMSSGVEEKSDLSLHLTRIGEQKTVDLPDGSRLVLNTATKVLIEQNETKRRVMLERGEVYFDVAVDPQRPFHVEIGTKALTVLGTEFNVDRRGDDFEVSVTEGVVALRGVEQDLQKGVLEPSIQQAPVSLDINGQHKLTVGMVAQYSAINGSLTLDRLDEGSAQFSWRNGIVHFNGESLSDVVLELNRYSVKRLIIADKTVMDIPVFASIKVGDMTTALMLLQGALPIQVSHQFDKVIISGK